MAGYSLNLISLEESKQLDFGDRAAVQYLEHMGQDALQVGGIEKPPYWRFPNFGNISSQNIFKNCVLHQTVNLN